jgi:glyoxylase-like metal-dependent hydrolase (beta-lactamase superfamily II)
MTPVTSRILEVRMFRKLSVAALLLTVLSTGGAAQNGAATVLANASKAMGVDTLTSITYSGTAENGAFGQSKAIAQPLGPVNLTKITMYTRTINFGPSTAPMALVSRATGPTQPPTVPGAPAPMPGVFNQNINGMQASTNWAQALNIWTTPWGFLKAAAAAGNATARQQNGQQVVSFMPANFKSPSGQSYTVTGYINNQNLVTRVETKVEHAVYGDLPVEFDYSNYMSMGGVQVPMRIVQKQGGMDTFNANITSATANPPNAAELLTPPPPAARGGGPGAPGAPAAAPPPAAAAAGPPMAEKLGEGVFWIHGNYASLAIDMGDHILVIESGQSDARGTAVMAAAKQAIPNKRITQVVVSHPHFDHLSGVEAAAAEGATLLIHRNSAQFIQRALSGPRTLQNDALSKVSNPKIQVQGIGDREVLRGTNGKTVEVHAFANEHSDSLVMVYLPAEKVLWTADVTLAGMANPNQLAVTKAAMAASDKLNLQWANAIPAHSLNPERIVPKTETQMLLGAAGPAH